MENTLTNSQVFAQYLKNPEGIDPSGAAALTALLDKFPYAQMLHAFQAKYHKDRNDFEKHLSKAALYMPDRAVLYNLVHHTGHFNVSPSADAEPAAVAPAAYNDTEEAERTAVEQTSTEHSDADHAEEDADTILPNEDITEAADHDLSSAATQEAAPVTEEEEQPIPEQDEIAEQPHTETGSSEEETIEAVIDETAPVYEPSPAAGTEQEGNTEEEYTGTEQTGIPDDQGTTMAAPEEQDEGFAATGETETGNIPDEDIPLQSGEASGDTSDEEQPEDDDAISGRSDETEKLILGNIAAADFFRFEDKLDDQLTVNPTGDEQPEASENEQQVHASGAGQSTHKVSRYDDDKMPYTFLWWLNKTRQEHASTYQPYVSFKLDTTQDIKRSPTEDLNHQIIENIFHLQSPLEEMKADEQPKTVEFKLKRKDEQIIERFIREEPQIRPPKAEQLDNENKAKRSSEDSYDMVSETLADIYIEQMLFHKAIDTYKKLSLKFPEKSAYFADQIRKLETSN